MEVYFREEIKRWAPSRNCSMGWREARCCFSASRGAPVSRTVGVSWRGLAELRRDGHHLYEALGITGGHAGTREGTRIPHQVGCRCSGRFS